MGGDNVRAEPANNMKAKKRSDQGHLYGSGAILSMSPTAQVRSGSANAMTGKVAGPGHLKASGDIIGHRGDVRERSSMQAKLASPGPRNPGAVTGEVITDHVEGLTFSRKTASGGGHLRSSGNIITNHGDVRYQNEMQGKMRSP